MWSSSSNGSGGSGVVSNAALLYHDCLPEYSADCECMSGFGRAEFKRDAFEKMAKYDHHVFLCVGIKSTDWSERIEEDHPMCKLFGAELRKLRRSAQVRVKMGVVEEGVSDPRLDNEAAVDVLVFPGAVRYRNVTADMVPQLVQSQFAQNGAERCPPPGAAVCEPLSGSHVFICCHHKRDARCGACGPRIFKSFVERVNERLSSSSSEKLKQQLQLHPSCREVRVYRTSDVSGHKYAGNVIIFKYSPDMKKYFGDWYGYVNDGTDVDRLVDEHLLRGKIVKDMWRGRCGMDLDAAKFLKFQ